MHRQGFLVDLLLALLVVAALAPGCSKNDPTAPPVVVSGPTFDFAYPMAATSHAFTFTQAGDWDYHCAVHPSVMKGKVFVRETSPRTSATITVAPGDANVFAPDTVTVGVGALVTWSKGVSIVSHTVTRP